MKKLFLFAAFFACTLSTFAYDFTSNGIYYNILGGDSVEITFGSFDVNNLLFNVNGEYAGSITIPETVEYNNTTYRVTSISDGAFCDCSNLSKITIPNSVTTIGGMAFGNCSSLVSITIGENVTAIGQRLFYGCSKLSSVIWNAKNCADFKQHNTPFYYYERGFDYNFDLRSQITSFIFGDKVESIPAYVCNGMRWLTTLTIPNSVTTIGHGAFRGCSALTAVTIGENVTDIGSWAFLDCSKLSSVTWNAKKPYTRITSSNETPFYYESSSAYYSSYNFDLRPQITSFTFGDKVESIPAYLCNGMSRLTTLTIPNNVTSIGDEAFYGCSRLTAVTWNAKNCASAPFSTIASQITAFTFGDEVETIPDSLCKNMQQLNTITIPNSTKSIGEEAFYNCSNLATTTIPNNVSLIGNNAFYNCSNLTRITWNAKNCTSTPFSTIASQITSFTFGDEVETIPDSLCKNMQQLAAITIPNSVKSIGESAFYNCASISAISIPSNVTSIGDNTFYNCSSLSAITIPNKVTSIGSQAFEGCSLLAKVNYTGTIDSWCDIHFDNNPLHNVADFYLNDVKVIDLPFSEKLTTIDTWFKGCKSIQSLTLPENITSISTDAFESCSDLTTITWNAKNCASAPFSTVASQITSFTFGDEVETIPASLCSGMQKVSTITFPNSLTSIGAKAFADCSQMGSIVIPNNVTRIEESTFANCSSIREIKFGGNISQIGDSALAGCTSLISLTIGADFPPVVYANTFKDVSTMAFIKVPCGATPFYQIASYWNNFTNYQEVSLYTFATKADDKTHGKVTVIQQPDCENENVAIFEAVPYNGYEFQCWNDGSTESYRIVEVIEDVEYIATFVKTSTSALENTTVDNNLSIHKVFEDGTIYIVKSNGERYTIDGRRVL